MTPFCRLSLPKMSNRTMLSEAYVGQDKGQDILAVFPCDTVASPQSPPIIYITIHCPSAAGGRLGISRIVQTEAKITFQTQISLRFQAP